VLGRDPEEMKLKAPEGRHTVMLKGVAIGYSDLEDADASLERVWQIQPGPPGQPGVVYAGSEPQALWTPNKDRPLYIS